MALLVGILWMFGWIPGIIAAFVINLMDPKPVERSGSGRFVQIPVRRDTNADTDIDFEKPKRKGEYIRLADGEIAEVIDDDGRMPETLTRKLRDE